MEPGVWVWNFIFLRLRFLGEDLNFAEHLLCSRQGTRSSVPLPTAVGGSGTIVPFYRQSN